MKPISTAPKDSASSLVFSTRSLSVDYLYLDLALCNRCQGTDKALEEALTALAPVLRLFGVSHTLNHIHVKTLEQAMTLGFTTSPTLRVNGKDIQSDYEETLCESCAEVCGDAVDCRVWMYLGETYTEPPAAMIADAILREVLECGEKEVPKALEKAPENLVHFFESKTAMAEHT